MIKMLVQVEAGSRDKNLYDEKTLEYKGESRISLPYPYPYGFVIGTNAADGDNVDCYLITQEKIKRGSIVECEPSAYWNKSRTGKSITKSWRHFPVRL